MGSGQSSSSDREASATTPKDFEKALEEQRKMNDDKMNKLLEEANRTANTSPPQHASQRPMATAALQQQVPDELLEASATTPKDFEKALEEQRKMNDDKMNKLLEEANRTANTSPPQHASQRPMDTAALQQQVPNELEAGATAKDFSRRLQEEAIRRAKPSTSLSPSLSSSRINVAIEALATTPKDFEKALEEQRKMNDDKMNKLLEEANRTANTSPPQHASQRPMDTAALQQQVPNELEAGATAKDFSRRLQEEAIRRAKPSTSLSPSLSSSRINVAIEALLATTPKDFEKALEEQRKMNDDKMNKLLEEANRTANTSPPQHASQRPMDTAALQQQVPNELEASATTPKDFEKALEFQRKMNDDKMNKHLEEMKRKANTSPPQQLCWRKRPMATAAFQQQVLNELEASATTLKDFEKALQEQRKMYDDRINKLLEDMKRTANTSPPQQLCWRKRPMATAALQQQVPNELEALATTHKDVEKALEEQRKMYDDKINKLLEEMNRTANTSPPQQASYRPMATAALQQQVPNELEILATTHKYVEKALEEQRKMYDDKINRLLEEMNRTANTSPPQQASYRPMATAALQQQVPNEFSRSRSQSRQRGGDNDVNCPTCGKMYGEIIYQCNQGHSSCDLCKTRQVPCGQCRRQLTDRRNYNLEKYIMKKKVPCPNSAEGCRLCVEISKMAIHEKKCPFNELQCPSLGYCTWRGKLSQLPAHFDGMHPLHNQGDVDKEMFLRNITNNSHTMHYIRIGNYNFLFHVKVSERDARIYMATQLIGTKHGAAKWKYEIHIYNKSEPRRKYQCSDTCSSANEPFQDIIDSTKCAVIPHEYAKTFICGGTLAYKFYIKRDDKPNEVSNATEDEGEQKAVRRGPPRRNNFKMYVKKH